MESKREPPASRLRVKGWSVFQHYKHRSPPWIRLYRNLLDNEDFWMLPVASRALAPCIWLLASESDDGTVSADPQRIAYRLRMTREDVDSALQPLIDHGFLIGRTLPASVVLAPCEQRATTEQSRDRVEAETEQSIGASRPSRLEVLADEVVACWNTRRDRKADAKRSASHVALVDKLDKAKYSREEILLVALVAAHHERGRWYRDRDGNSGLLIALGLGGRPRQKDGVVASLTKNHFADLLESTPYEYGPQMAALLTATGLTQAAAARGWKERAA